MAPEELRKNLCAVRLEQVQRVTRSDTAHRSLSQFRPVFCLLRTNEMLAPCVSRWLFGVEIFKKIKYLHLGARHHPCVESGKSLTSQTIPYSSNGMTTLRTVRTD
jgi:hypothetical protein